MSDRDSLTPEQQKHFDYNQKQAKAAWQISSKYSAVETGVDDAVVKYQDRTESVSNRSLLANALESATTNDIERQKLHEYKEQIETLDAHEKKLRKLNEQMETGA